MYLPRKWIGIISGILGFLALVQVSFLIWANPIAERAISRAVPLLTQGNYCVDSLEVAVGFWDQSIQVNNLSISIDSVNYVGLDTPSTQPRLRNFSVPQIQITWFDLLRLLQKREFSMSKIHLVEPMLRLTVPNVFQREEGRGVDTENPDLFPFVEPVLQAVYIGDFEWEKGRIEVEIQGGPKPDYFEAREISISIADIQIDSTSYDRSGRPFYAESLFFGLDVTDYTVVLPDSNYQVQAKELNYSTRKSSITIDSLQMLPLEGRPRSASAPLSITVPQFVVQGIQPGEILFDRYLGLDSVFLRGLQVGLSVDEQGAQAGSGSKFLSNPNDMFPLISQALDAVHVDYIGVHDGRFDLVQGAADSLLQVQLQDVSLDFHNLDINEGSAQKRDRLFCTEMLDLQMGSFSLYTAKDDFVFEGERFSFSTESQSFAVESLVATPRDFSAPRIISGNVPHVLVEGINLPQIVFGKTLSLNRIDITQPSFEYADFPQRRKEKLNAIALSRPDTILSKVFKGLQIDTLSLSEGIFTLNDDQRNPQNAFRAEQISLEVEAFQMEDFGNRELVKLFQVDEIQLAFDVRDYFLRLPDSSYILSFPRLHISSMDSVLYADSLQVLPYLVKNSDTTVFELEVPEIRITGWDPYAMYFQQVMELDSVVLVRPAIRRMKYYDQAPQPLPQMEELDLYPFIQKQLGKLSVESFWIQQGNYESVSMIGAKPDTTYWPDLTLLVQNFYLDENSQNSAQNFLYTDDIYLRLNAYDFVLPDSQFVLSLGELAFSTSAQQLLLDSIHVRPLDPDSPEGLVVNVPQMRLAGVDIFELLSKRKLELDRVLVQEPAVSMPFQLDLPNNNSDSLPPIDLFPVIQPIMDVLSIATFKIDGGSLNLQEAQEDGSDLAIGNISFEVDKFLLDSLAQAQSTKPFYAESISLNADVPRYSLVLPDSSYRIEFRDIGLSTVDSLFYVDSLRLEALGPGSSDALQVGLSLERLQLEGIDLTEVYFDQVLALKRLRLTQPQIQLVVNQKPKRDSTRVQGFNQRQFITQDPYPQLSEVFGYVDIERIELEEGRLEVEGPEIQPLDLKGFSFSAQNFRLDSIAYQLLDDTYLFSDDISFEILDFEVPMPDSAMYTLDLGKIGLSTANEHLYIENLVLTPVYDRYEFGRIKQEIVDRWSVKNRRIDMFGLDVHRLIKEQEIFGRELQLYEPRVEIFKDKRYPFPYKRPNMPWEDIREWNTYVHVDSVWVMNGYVFYEERNPDTDTTAWFKLSELRADLGPVTNDPFMLLQEPEMYLKANATVMDTAFLALQATIPITDTSNYHVLEGDVWDLPAPSLNPILENTASIKATDGDIHQVYFRFRADNQMSRGKMKMYYNDLKVNLLNPKPQKKRGLGRLFGSALANTFVVHSDNPRRFLRVGRIDFERERNKGFIVYWVKSLIDGIKSSVGITKKDEKVLE